MANKQIGVPYVTEETIQVVTNNNKFPLDIICEGPLYMVPSEVELQLEDGTIKTETVLKETKDVQQIGTINAFSSEAVRAEIKEGKCVWRLLK